MHSFVLQADAARMLDVSDLDEVGAARAWVSSVLKIDLGEETLQQVCCPRLTPPPFAARPFASAREYM